jgi:ketosteroid isomerase-like protein
MYSESVTTTSQAAEQWVALFAEGWRAPSGPHAFAEHFRELLAADVRLIQPQLPTAIGHRAFEEEFVEPLFALIEDLHGVIERWGSRGDALYIELTLRGKLAGRPLCLRVCDRVTLRDGVAIERESYFDPAPLIAAVIRTPRAWPGFLRLQARKLANHRTRSKR